MAKTPALETEIAKIADILRDGYVSSYVKNSHFRLQYVHDTLHQAFKWCLEEMWVLDEALTGVWFVSMLRFSQN